MSKINQIQKAIAEQEGGAFQKLADSYMHEKGYCNLNPIGSAIGDNKVRQGTPDTFARQEDGRFIFVEHTTDRTNLPKKLKGDLDKCLDESKTGVPVKDIAEIVLCYTSNLTPEEEGPLYDVCREAGVNLTLYGMGPISFDLCYTYPGLAKDHLGISIDTGQVLSPRNFVDTYGKNQLTTPLDTEFCFRGEEVTNTLAEITASPLVLLSGPAGVGKSRLALEVMRKFIESQPDYKAFCIFNRGQDVLEDLKIYFSRPGKFLLLVDDANRINRFDYVVDLIAHKKDNQDIKVIATVRDYAIEGVQKTSKALGHVGKIPIEPMSDEQIGKMVEKLYGIRNSHFLERITQVAKGNPRLAVMASKIAVQKDNLNSILDVSSLYDEYFDSIRQDLQRLDDPDVLKVAGITSFFRSVDNSHDALMNSIEENFGIDRSSFWRAANILHDYELADIYENDVVKISDQVVATYLFNLSVFRNKVLDFGILVEKYFPDHIERLVEAISSCLSAFDFEALSSAMRPAVIKKWQLHLASRDDRSLAKLVKLFWFILQSEALSYLRDAITALEPESIDLDAIEWDTSNTSLHEDSILQLLGVFANAGDVGTWQVALDLIYGYAKKKCSDTPKVLRVLTQDYGFSRHSHLERYKKQHLVIDSLIAKTQRGEDIFYSRLFVALAKYYLMTQFQQTEGNKHTITWHKFSLIPCPEIFSLREKIWQLITKLYGISALQFDVLYLIRHYSHAWYLLDMQEIVQKDSEYLSLFFQSRLDPDVFLHCLVVQDCLKLFGRGAENPSPELALRFNGAAYQIYSVFALDYRDVMGEVEDYEGYERIKKDRIRRITQRYSFDEYKKLLTQCVEIDSVLQGHGKGLLKSGIIDALIMLSEDDLSLYTKVLEYYFSLGDPFGQGLLHMPLVSKLIEACGARAAKEIIKAQEYQTRRLWEFAYLQALEEGDITRDDLEELYVLYAHANELPINYDYLLNYKALDNFVVQKVTQIIVGRSKSEARFGGYLILLFNPHTEVNKQLFNLFTGAFELLKDAYIAYTNVDQNPDYNGAMFSRIMDVDPNFIIEHIDRIYEDSDHPSYYSETRDFSFLWRRSDAKQVMAAAVKAVLEHENGHSVIHGGYLGRLFCIDESRTISDDVLNSQDDFLAETINNNAMDPEMMMMVFDVIANFKPERRHGFVALFLSHNQRYEDFRRLELEPSVYSVGKSAVPSIMRRIEYWQSLLPLCNSVELLDHKRHIERQIQGLQHYLESERKSDFMGD